MMRCGLFLLSLFFCCLLQAENLRYGTLENGMRYLILSNPNAETIELRLQVDVGASDEDEDEQGAAHFVEHMLFHSAKSYPEGIANHLRALGLVRGRGFNALTNFERTLYSLRFEDIALLEEGLFVLKAMMHEALFLSQDVEIEREIVLAEWRDGQTARERLNRKRSAIMRQGSRQARHGILGSFSSIENLSAQKLYDFYKKWYQPQNMRLLIAGNLSPDAVEQWLEENLGQLANAPLPVRDQFYYEPKLKANTQITHLKDTDSRLDQVALIFRLDDAITRDYQSDLGIKARLLDKLTLNILQNRLKELANGAVIRKADIGRRSIAVGIFANVSSRDYESALQEIFAARAYLLQEITKEEWQSAQQEMAQSLVRSRESGEYGAALFKISQDFFSSRPFPWQESVEKQQEILKDLRPEDGNQWVARWLEAEDIILQYQTIAGEEVLFLGKEELHARLKNTKAPEIDGLKTQAMVDFVFANPLPRGKILKNTTDAYGVHYLQLANGDVLYWLKDSRAGEYSYLITEAVIEEMEDLAWQTQIASQILAQTPPQGASQEAFIKWQKDKDVQISITLKENIWRMQGRALSLEDLGKIYHATLRTTPEIDNEALWQNISEEARLLERPRAKIEQEIERLRYGKIISKLPTQALVLAQSAKDWQQTYALLSQSKARHYLLSNAKEEEVILWVEKYLANLERQDSKNKLQKSPLLKGRKVIEIQNDNMQGEVHAYTWQQVKWQGVTAAHIDALNIIASDALKAVLRDEALGVYRVYFKSQFDDRAQQIKSYLYFRADHRRSEALMQLAEKVLNELPERLSEEDIHAMRLNFAQAENTRQNDPQVLLNRLALSIRHYGDGRYLLEVEDLGESFNEEWIKESARLIWNSKNQRVLLIK